MIPNILSYIILAILIPLIIFLSTFFILPFLVGAPYESIEKKYLKKMLSLSHAKSGEKMVDLGSGDGRIVIEFAKKGVFATGFEINPFLVLYSRRKIKKMKLEKFANIHWKNFWKENLKEFSIITTFQYFTVSKRLEQKIKNECKKNTRVISHYWKFPTMNIEKQTDKIYLYKI